MKENKWNLYTSIGWFLVGCINFYTYFTNGFDAAIGGVAILNIAIGQIYFQKHIKK